MTNKEVAHAFFNAADSGDFTAVKKLFGAKHQFHSSMSPVPMNAEQHLGMMQAFHGGFSNTRHDVHDLFDAGNKVVARGVWNGMHTGEFNGIPASGNEVRLPFIAIAEVENDEMVNQWIELDSMTLMTQIGAVPAPEAAM